MTEKFRAKSRQSFTVENRSGVLPERAGWITFFGRISLSVCCDGNYGCNKCHDGETDEDPAERSNRRTNQHLLRLTS